MKRLGVAVFAIHLFVLLPGIGAGQSLLPSSRGMLLPLQNRTGDAEIVDRLETRLKSRLAVHLVTADTSEFRDDLRRQRMRTPSRALPSELLPLAEKYEIDWFVSVTLHHAARSRNDEIIVSAVAFATGEDEILWADVVSATSWDFITWFGRGEGWTLEDLVDDSVDRLVDSLTGISRNKNRLQLGRSKRGFFRAEMPDFVSRPVAVIPMSSATEKETVKAAEVATATLLANLQDHDFRVLHPGLVNWALRIEGKYQLGAVGKPVRTRLFESEGVMGVFTGTVERFEIRPGFRDGPRVELSLRLLETQSGQILWMDGADHAGVDTKTVFEQNIIYSTGVLTHEIVNSLIAGIPRFGRLKS